MSDGNAGAKPGATGRVDAGTRAKIEELLRAGNPAEVPDRSMALRDARLRQETRQSKTLFRWALWAVSAQLVIADLVFFVYIIVTWARGQDVPAPVISAWLAATVIEVVGIVAIIARSLFPPDPQR